MKTKLDTVIEVDLKQILAATRTCEFIQSVLVREWGSFEVYHCF